MHQRQRRTFIRGLDAERAFAAQDYATSHPFFLQEVIAATGNLQPGNVVVK
jgi:hypothetical protein